jgi:hypothetical protein
LRELIKNLNIYSIEMKIYVVSFFWMGFRFMCAQSGLIHEAGNSGDLPAPWIIRTTLGCTWPRKDISRIHFPELLIIVVALWKAETFIIDNVHGAEYVTFLNAQKRDNCGKYEGPYNFSELDRIYSNICACVPSYKFIKNVIEKSFSTVF